MTLALDLGDDAYSLGIDDADRDSWTTPEWLWGLCLDALDRETFDLDPCSNDRATVPASTRVVLPYDGLRATAPPSGNVWLNPPYSDVAPWFAWAQRQSQEHNAVVLGVVPLAPGIKAWREHGPDIAWPLGRVCFDPPPGVKASTPNQEHALILWHSYRPRVIKLAAKIEKHERVRYRMERT